MVDPGHGRSPRRRASTSSFPKGKNTNRAIRKQATPNGMVTTMA